MKGKQAQNRVNPTPMITTITEIFKPVLKKPALKNVILTVIALAKSFRINEIASCPDRIGTSQDETETAASLLGLCLSHRCGDGVLLGFVLRRVCHAEEPDASFLPSGENATAWTLPVCPGNVAIGFCVETSHSSTLSSQDPEASIVPSGENATEKLADVSSLGNVVRYYPVSTSHNLTSSNDAEASFVPSGENATEKTGALMVLFSISTALSI